jgi:four helix bundle protein
MGVQNFRESIAWQKAMDLSVAVYALTRTFPKEELFGLTSQLRRASVSIASNVAEGQGRLTTREFLHFAGIARGSAIEVQTQLELAERLGLGDSEQAKVVQAQATNVARTLNSVVTGLRAKLAEEAAKNSN